MKRTSVLLTMVLSVIFALVVFVPEAGAITRNVSILDGPSRYSPRTITVNRGDRVRWTNNGTRAHTVSRDGGGWSSGTLAVGARFSRLFNTRGTFNYHCNFHSAMHGTVVVQ